MPHDVDAEARDAGNDVGEVGAVLFLEPLLRGARHDLAQRLFDELRRQDFLAQRRAARRTGGCAADRRR